MNQKTTIVILVVVLAALGYWLFTRDTAEAPSTIEPNDTLVPSVSEPTETSDTSIETPTSDVDYIGLTEAEATTLAEERGVPLRVVERDGQMLPTTRDYRPGRINAVATAGVVTSYTVEGTEMDKGGETPEPINNGAAAAGEHDAIIGMTQAEAEAYAASKQVSFRLGSIDGEMLPVTMDYRPGRITASIVDGVVTAYTVEGSEQ